MGSVMANPEPVVLRERSSTSCAVASWQGRIHLAWTGTDMHVNTISSPDGRRFDDKQTLRHRSSKTVTRETGTTGRGGATTTTESEPLAPALAATPDGFHLAWTGTDRRLNVAGPGLGGADHLVLPERSWLAPALGAWGHDLMLAWTGTDRHLNLLHIQGDTWTDPWRLDETSSRPPTIGSVGREMVMAWTGTDRHLNLLQTDDGAWGQSRRLDETSSKPPAVCAVGDELVLAWTGTDRHLNFVTLRPGEPPGTPVRLPATSSHSPALCTYDDGLALAWTGTNQRLNVARLHPVR